MKNLLGQAERNPAEAHGWQSVKKRSWTQTRPPVAKLSTPATCPQPKSADPEKPGGIVDGSHPSSASAPQSQPKDKDELRSSPKDCEKWFKEVRPPTRSTPGTSRKPERTFPRGREFDAILFDTSTAEATPRLKHTVVSAFFAEPVCRLATYAACRH